MEHSRWDVSRLPCFDRAAFLAEAHLPLAFDDEVDFFLLLVVPRDLSPVWLERDIAHGEVGRLDRGHSPDKVLRAAPRGIGAALDFSEVGDGHEKKVR